MVFLMTMILVRTHLFPQHLVKFKRSIQMVAGRLSNWCLYLTVISEFGPI